MELKNIELDPDKKTEFYKNLANFTLNDLMGIANKKKKKITELNISPTLLANLVLLKVCGELDLKELKAIVELLSDKRNKLDDN